MKKNSGAGHSGAAEAEQRALAASRELAATEVQRLPGYMSDRVLWLRSLATLVAKDAARLTEAPLEPPLEAHEVALFAPLLKLLEKGIDAAAATPKGVRLSKDEVALVLRVRGAQAKLDRAFRVRYREDAAMLRVLREVRRGDKEDPLDALEDARRLTELAGQEVNRGWLARLTKGEPAAVTALRDAIPGLEATASRLASFGVDKASRLELQRVGTLLLRLADRVVTAGRYYTADLAGREGDYKRFARPQSRKRKGKSKAADASAAGK